MKPSLIQTSFTKTILILFLCAIAYSGWSATWYVKTTGDDSNAGNSWTQAYQTIQKAIDSASAGDEIWVGQGTYLPTQEIDGTKDSQRHFTFYLDVDIKIYGGFPDSGNPTMANRDWETFITTLSGDFNGDDGANFSNTMENAYTVVYSKYVSTAFVMDGFVIEGGNSDASGTGFISTRSGGAWFNNGSGAGNSSNPHILNCTFQNNQAKSGGAMINYGKDGTSSPIMTNCRFLNNHAFITGHGGALYNQCSINGTSSPTLTDCIFQNNQGKVGGAVLNLGQVGACSPIFNNCSFQNNQASTNGGAVFSVVDGTSSPIFTNCNFQNNLANKSGGALFNNGLNGSNIISLTNCSFQGNEASSSGGAIFNVTKGTSSVSLANCSFQNNQAGFGGGAVGNSILGTGSILLNNSNFINNNADKRGGAIYNENRDTSSISIDNCLFQNNNSEWGGAIYNFCRGTSFNTLKNNFFEGNQGVRGGAMFNHGIDTSSFVFTNCSLFDNQAEHGGGMYNNCQDLNSTKLINCNFYNNQATGVGGALRNFSTIGSNPFLFQNCIFWQNIGDGNSMNNTNCNPQISYSLLEENNCPPGANCGSGMIYGLDPLFVNPSNGDLNLQACSPAVDVGSNMANTEMYDLEGNARKHDAIIGGDIIDLGAIEYQQNVNVTAICQPVTKILDANGSALIVDASDLDNGSSADCGLASMLINGVASLNFDCNNTGLNNVTLTATDIYGQTSNCMTTVTIKDNTKPNAQCQNKTIELDANGQANITTNDIDNGSSDACGIKLLNLSHLNFDCNDLGEKTVTLTVTDDNDNEKTCTAKVTVEDNINPEITCPANITTAMDDGLCGAMVTWESITATDNCEPIITQISGEANGSFFSEGTHTIEYKATDESSNESDICSFNVTVEGDVEKPNFNNTCASYPTAFNTDADQCYSSINFTTPNPTDNCGITELKAKIWDSNGNVDQNWTTNPDGQFVPDTYQIKWRAKDAAGNKKVCAANFTVQDGQDPDAQCVASHVVQLSGGIGSITTNDIDTGSSDNCNYNLSLSKTSFDCNDRGTQTVTMTATDDAGNTHQCTSDIEIKGTTLSIDDVSQNEGNGTGFTFFFFKLERAANGCTEQVDYETTDGDATLADNDYVYGSGTAYYPPTGSNTRYVICRGKKDSKYESDEDFWVELSNPTTGVTFTKDKGEGMLMNDDVAPLIGNSNGQMTDYQLLEGKANLYPNPVVRELTISTPYHWLEKGSIRVELLDVLGRTLSAFELTEDHTVVDMSALMVGQYELLFVTKDGRRVSEKFVKMD